MAFFKSWKLVFSKRWQQTVRFTASWFHKGFKVTPIRIALYFFKENIREKKVLVVFTTKETKILLYEMIVSLLSSSVEQSRLSDIQLGNLLCGLWRYGNDEVSKRWCYLPSWVDQAIIIPIITYCCRLWCLKTVDMSWNNSRRMAT